MVDWRKWRADVLEEMLSLGLGEEEAAVEMRRSAGRMRARLAWLEALFDELRLAHGRCSEDCADLSDEEIEADVRLPEFVELDRIERIIDGLRCRGRWLRHLHWSDV